MKVLQINCVYDYGSTGKIVATFHHALMEQNIDSYVLYGRGAKTSDEFVYKVSSEFEGQIHSVLSKLFGVDFGYSPLATHKTIKYIKKIKPDVVHLHCLNGHFINVYRLLNYLKKNHIKTVLTLHAEIMHTAGCVHAVDCEKWKKQCSNCPKIKGKISRYFRDDAKHCASLMKKALSGFDDLTVVGVSDWLTNRAKQADIMPDVKFATVNNGIDVSIFCYKQYNKADFSKYKTNNRSLILHVTPNFNNPIKGGKYVLELAEKMPECDFFIVGYNGNGENLPLNVKTLKMTENKEELAKIYSIADVTLLTSKRETFSMVCAESLSCGTPVVGFEAGGPEQISLPQYSEFVEQGNVPMLEAALKNMISEAVKFDKKEISDVSVKEYSSHTYAEKFLVIYKS